MDGVQGNPIYRSTFSSCFVLDVEDISHCQTFCWMVCPLVRWQLGKKSIGWMCHFLYIHFYHTDQNAARSYGKLAFLKFLCKMQIHFNTLGSACNRSRSVSLNQNGLVRSVLKIWMNLKTMLLLCFLGLPFATFSKFWLHVLSMLIYFR